MTARVEEVWLVRHEGDLLYRHPGRPDPEAQYQARRLVATLRFVHDSLTEPGPPQVSELTFGDRRLALLGGRFLVLAAFVRGRPSQRFRERMGDALRGLEATFEDSLRDWKPGTTLPDLERFLSDLTGPIPAGP